MPSSNGDSPVPRLHPIAELYGKWAFNFMVEVATAIAHDFFDRPQHYREAADGTEDILTSFRSLVGSHPDWPDAEQRISIFRGTLSAACLAGAPLREAALVYVEQGTERNQDLLLDAFQDAATSFRGQLRTLEGQALDIGAQQIGAIFDNTVKLFKSSRLMRVLDLPAAAPEEDWPLNGNFAAESAYLVTEAIRTLEGINAVRAAAGGTNRPLYISMSPSKFESLQRAAYHGGLAMSELLMRTEATDDPRRPIGNIYKWTKALQRLVPNVPRAWKDLHYRLRLTDFEWGMVDRHPSGEISLPGSASRSASETYTVHGEICCCGGDLESSSNCEVSPNPSCINCGSLGIRSDPALRARVTRFIVEGDFEGGFEGGGFGGGGAGGCY